MTLSGARLQIARTAPSSIQETTMTTLSLLPVALPALALGASLALPLPAAGVGDPLPTPELEKFKQTEAQSFEDLFGRVVIIEFFEYW